MFMEALALAMSSGRSVIHDDSLSLPVAKAFGVSRYLRIGLYGIEKRTKMSGCHYEANGASQYGV
jgi:hypothetical protein